MAVRTLNTREEEEVAKEPLYKELKSLNEVFQQVIYEAPIKNANLLIHDLKMISTHIRWTYDGLQYLPYPTCETVTYPTDEFP